MSAYVFTSESVSEGHPDKVADLISDSVLDACLARDPGARVACETLVKGGHVFLAGEVSIPGQPAPDWEDVVRAAVRSVGYTDPADLFAADTLRVHAHVTEQSDQIRQGVSGGEELGAGDQGLMFGYATDETPELMPLPVLLAHRLAAALASDRKRGAVPFLRPDSKTQVSVAYQDEVPVGVTAVLVSTQHAPGALEQVSAYVREDLLPRVLGDWYHPGIEVLINTAGEWTVGGPAADAGLTGRKIIVDTYGGRARHGGGAFSGKDATKVDRSGAYFCRWLARQVVARGLARRAEIQVAYAIGRAAPVSVAVDTFHSGDDAAAAAFVARHDFRPAAIIERLGLDRPIYRATTNYGHFGRPGLPWEEASADGLIEVAPAARGAASASQPGAASAR